MSSDNKTCYFLYYNFGTLKYHYAKTICLISLQFTAFNKDSYSYLHMNFLRDQMSSKVGINFNNID